MQIGTCEQRLESFVGPMDHVRLIYTQHFLFLQNGVSSHIHYDNTLLK